jgi:hypothetical protein
MEMNYKIDLTAREAQVIYIALSNVRWMGRDAEAELAVRTRLEKMAMKKGGRSLHDYLTENDVIDGSDKPDIRTVKQKQADLAAQHKAEKLALAGEP